MWTVSPRHNKLIGTLFNLAGTNNVSNTIYLICALSVDVNFRVWIFEEIHFRRAVLIIHVLDFDMPRFLSGKSNWQCKCGIFDGLSCPLTLNRTKSCLWSLVSNM